MKIRLNKILFFGILVQIISTQGIFTFYIFKQLGHWELKSFLHPLSFFLILFIFFLKATKRLLVTKLDLLFFTFYLGTFLFVFNNVDGFFDAYLSFRDVYMLFLLIFIYNQTYISEKQWDLILRVLYFFIVANIFFVILTYILGPEGYMKLMTGRFYWDMDPEYKFKISNFAGTKLWRPPGLVGEAGSLAYFGLLSYVLMEKDKKYRFKKFLCLILTVLCFTRNAYLVLGLYILLKFVLQKKNFVKIYLIIKYSIPLFIMAILYISQYNLFSIKSVYMRINHWIHDIDVPYNLLYGGAIGKSGASVRGEGFAAVIDNYYLLMLFSVGLIGIILMFLFIYEKVRFDRNLSLLCISTGIAAVFITLTHGMTFLVLFPLLFLKKNSVNEL